MQFGAKSANPPKTRSHCLTVAVYENGGLSPSASLLDKASGGHIRKILKRGDIKGKAGQTQLLHDVPGISASRILLVGFGHSDNISGAKFSQAVTAAINALKQTACANTLVCLLEVEVKDRDEHWKTRRIVEDFEHSAYRYVAMKGKPPENGLTLAQVDLQVNDRTALARVKAAVEEGLCVASGVRAARDLGNTPANICNPTYLAAAAEQLAKDKASITTTLIDEKEMEKLGMGALLSVGQGSQQPSKLIIMQHKGAKASDKPHILVGKGITFDSGGISIKPAATMYEMIYDMCGAASVFGVMTAVADLNLPINVVGAITSAENMPSGSASRPGDIVKSMSGQTIEILNTDAEGRLVLCDALTYIEKYNPETVIDIATLTGAMVTALGSQASGVFANDDGLAADILAAGEASLDRAWRMPLWDEYQTQINSPFADMANTGGREAGSITAACFLSRFTKKYRWAHMDIAGTAWKSGSQKNATGRPVRLLIQYLLNKAYP